MHNETITKFGYPATLVFESSYWVVLLRQKQTTAGALVLACKEEAASLGEVSRAAFGEFPAVVKQLETALRSALDHEKVNYIALMMVDKHVHFHVIPRYSAVKHVCGVDFQDSGWPKHPDMTKTTEVTPAQFEELRKLISKNWPSRSN